MAEVIIIAAKEEEVVSRVIRLYREEVGDGQSG